MAYGTKVAFEAVREVAAASITASYTAVGTATIDHSRLVSISNGTDADCYISLDGVTNHLRLASNSFKLLDLTSNKVSDDGLFIAQGTIFYVKRVSGAPTTGTLWIEVMYASGGV
jgi:hypothetical protein